MQCGFMSGKRRTDALFVVKRIQEEYRDKEQKLHMCFTNIEKAFDRVPRIARVVKSLCHKAKIKVRV